MKLKFFTLLSIQLIAVYINCFTNISLHASGWSYDFSGKTISQLEEEGFRFTNFNSGASGVTTNNLGNAMSIAKTPYFLLGEQDYFTFSGARLSSAAGNGAVTVTLKLERIDGTIAAQISYNMQDASSDDIPRFEFGDLERGFYRVVIELSYTGNKKDVQLTLQSFQSNLPNETFTPEVAATAIEIFSDVNTDKLQYYQTEPATISFKVFFAGIGGTRPINRVIYELVVPEGFKVNSSQLKLSFKPGSPNQRADGLMEGEEIILDEEAGLLFISSSTTDRIIDITMDSEAIGDPGLYGMESILDDADPGHINDNTDAETPAIIIVPFGTLPVELIFFEANVVGRDVRLDWATATEKNNDYFAIERSSDGRNFREIGRVEGNGNHSGRLNYSFTDNNPSGTLFYRLKQVDFDGSFEYSEVRRVQVSLPKVVDATIFPNPMVGGALNIVLNELIHSKEVRLQVLDSKGQTVYRKAVNSQDLTPILSLEMDGLPVGSYLIQISTDTERILKRFLVSSR